MNHQASSRTFFAEAAPAGHTVAAKAGEPAPDVAPTGVKPRNHPSVPDHEMLRVIGQGAYGEVWLARNIFGDYRAVKIMRRRQFGAQDRGFEREFEGIKHFEPISRSHPSQLAILHVGKHQDGGYFYYVMELADAARVQSPGPGDPSAASPAKSPAAGSYPQPSTFNSDAYVPHTLRVDLQHNRLPVAAVVELGLALTEALGHLHRQGLVHRDVKPSNIVFVQGRPKLADIGLVTESSDTCSIVGTEGYLPPEGPGTPPADVYALGKVLYEAATGLDRRQFPRLPDDLPAWPDTAKLFELNEILVRACAAAADERYGSAEEMRGDLESLARGGSLRYVYRNRRRWELISRWVRWLAPVAAVCGLVVLARGIPHQAPSRVPGAVATNEVANRFYRAGLYYFEKNDDPFIGAAITNFQAAISQEPGFAAAHAALAMAYLWSNKGGEDYMANLPAAHAAAQQAMNLDPSLSAPYIVLGWYCVFYEWDWPEAEKDFKRAIALSPSSASGYHFYAEFLRMTGRTNEALRNITEALRLEPGSLIIARRFVDHLIAARQYQQAIMQAQLALTLEPRVLASAHGFRIRALCALGMYTEAIDEERKARLLSGEPVAEVDQDAGNLQKVYGEEGRKGYWRLRLEIASRPATPYWRLDTRSPYWDARAYAQIGERQKAIESLETALEHHEFWLTFYVMTDWALDPLRSEPGFLDILKRMHLK